MLNFYHDWDSFSWWREPSWREFSLFTANFEWGGETVLFEYHFALIGFHVWGIWLNDSSNRTVS